MSDGKAVPSGLYTTEGGASRKRAKAEQVVKDPRPSDGEAILKEETLEVEKVEEDDGDPN